MKKPETLHVLIPSEGFADGRPTRHTFSHAEPVRVGPSVYGDKTSSGTAFIFRCDKTGHLRRFGIE